MLQRLEVKNFLALRDVSLDLEPFTVLVGANASGKTTILEALHRVCGLQNGYHRMLVEGGDYVERFNNGETLVINPTEVLNQNATGDIEFHLVFNNQTHKFSIIKNDKDGRLEAWNFRVFQKDSPSSTTGSYSNNLYAKSLFLLELGVFAPSTSLIQANFSSLSRPSVSPLPVPFLERSGAGLPTICAATQQEFPDAFDQVQKHLTTIIKGLKRFRIRRAESQKSYYVNINLDTYNFEQIIGTAEQLIFDFDDAVGVPAKYVSEGTLLVLCILVAAARFEGEALILIDDLERGLHPKAVRDLIGALRKLQEINPKLQIVATSHSPYILSELKPQEVRVVARDPERGTVVGRLTDHPDFAKWSEVMDVGEFWSHVGEDWLLKRKEYA